MMWGYIAIGILIGEAIGGAVGLYVGHKDSTVRGMAMQIQGYCAELDCYECEFMRKDGTCELKTPVSWKIDKEDDE